MRLLITFVLLLSGSLSAFACDENCQKRKAERAHNVEFPAYLSWSFCETTKTTFLDTDIRSLQAYRDERMTTKYRGNMRNIKRFIDQRVDWLKECNDYLVKTGKAPLFSDQPATDKIFSAMTTVSGELDDLVKGVTYSDKTGSSDVAVAGEKFDHFFKLVDDQKTLIMLKGQFVVRE